MSLRSLQSGPPLALGLGHYIQNPNGPTWVFNTKSQGLHPSGSYYPQLDHASTVHNGHERPYGSNISGMLVALSQPPRVAQRGAMSPVFLFLA